MKNKKKSEVDFEQFAEDEYDPEMALEEEDELGREDDIDEEEETGAEAMDGNPDGEGEEVTDVKGGANDVDDTRTSGYKKKLMFTGAFKKRLLTVQLNSDHGKFTSDTFGAAVATGDLTSARRAFAKAHLKRKALLEANQNEDGKPTPVPKEEIERCAKECIFDIRGAELVRTWNSSPYNLCADSPYFEPDTCSIDKTDCCVSLRRNHACDEFTGFHLHATHPVDRKDHDDRVEVLKRITPEKLNREHRVDKRQMVSVPRDSDYYKAIQRFESIFNPDDVKAILEGSDDKSVQMSVKAHRSFANALFTHRTFGLAIVDGNIEFRVYRSDNGRDPTEELKNSSRFVEKGVLSSEDVEEFKDTPWEAGFQLIVDGRFTI